MESLLNGKRFFCREWAFQETIIFMIERFINGQTVV